MQKYIYAQGVHLTSKLSRITLQTPELRSCQQVGALLSLKRRARTFENRKCFHFCLFFDVVELIKEYFLVLISGTLSHLFSEVS